MFSGLVGWGGFADLLGVLGWLFSAGLRVLVFVDLGGLGVLAVCFDFLWVV